MSWMGYMFCKRQMENLWLEWLPWLDTKTFEGWKKMWFIVKKGEHAKIHWLTWVAVKDEDDAYRYPKVYNLFHTSQVEPIGEAEFVEKEMAMANAE